MSRAFPLRCYVFVMLAVVGCSSQKPEPHVASSVAQANYAASYPADLQSTANGYVNAELEVRRATGEFAKYPDQLKDPPWPLVQTIVTRADEAGQSASYVEARRQAEAEQAFFTADNNEITRRVAGSAQYVTKKKECDVDVTGTVGASLKEAVDKQIEKGLRAHNDAHLIIERYRESLGRPNAAALDKQVDDISSASYLANIRAVELKGETLRLIDEASTVKRTLQQSIDEERAFQAEAGRSAADKKASSERIAKMEDSKVRIDAAIPQLQALAKDIDQRNDAMRKEYAAALDNLRRAIAARAARP